MVVINNIVYVLLIRTHLHISPPSLFDKNLSSPELVFCCTFSLRYSIYWAIVAINHAPFSTRIRRGVPTIINQDVYPLAVFIPFSVFYEFVIQFRELMINDL